MCSDVNFLLLLFLLLIAGAKDVSVYFLRGEMACDPLENENYFYLSPRDYIHETP